MASIREVLFQNGVAIVIHKTAQHENTYRQLGRKLNDEEERLLDLADVALKKEHNIAEAAVGKEGLDNRAVAGTAKRVD